MENLLTALVKATGWSIINSLWQGAVIYMVLVLVFTVSPRLTARTRHDMSFLGLSAMFIWFVQTLCFQLGQALDAGGTSGSLALPVSAAYATSVNEAGFSFLTLAGQSIPFIVFIYSGGLIAQVIFLVIGYRRVSLIKRRGITELPDELRTSFIALGHKLGIKRAVIFAQSADVSVPLVIGYLKPVVLLPLSVLTQFTPQQLEAIIIHELSHIRRNDYLLNMLKVSIETILFFNPFVWLTAKITETERENACDDLVLKLTGNPLEYALTLLELEKIKHHNPQFSMAISGRKHKLLNRIRRITDANTRTVNLKVQLLALVIGISGILSLAWSPLENKRQEAKTLLTKEKPAAPLKEEGIHIPHLNRMTAGPAPVRIATAPAAKSDQPVSRKQPDPLAEVPEKKSAEVITAPGGGSKLTIAGVSKNFHSNLAADSVKTVIWLNREGKIISADPKIIYYSKTLPGYTIDQDGNILDGERNWLDKLAGGKPIVKIDSTGEMSRSYSNVTVAGFTGNTPGSAARTITGMGAANRPGGLLTQTTESITRASDNFEVIMQLKQSLKAKNKSSGLR